MNPPIFHNRFNPTVFLSRSVAVMVVPILLVDEDLWVPLMKRGPSVSDSGLWCLPCGYLDYDESGSEAAIREACEEIGLDLTGKLSDQPWFVNSDPNSDARQNVALRFGCMFEVEKLPPLTFDLDEATEVDWFLAYAATKRTDLAFGHEKIIGEYLQALEGQKQL